MGRWIKKITQAGLCLCLSVLFMTGCNEKNSQENKADVETKTESENKVKEEKTEIRTESTPSFIQDGIRKVILIKDGEEIFYLSKEPADYKMEFDYWEILNPYDETMTVNTEEMYNLFDALCEFDFQTPVDVAEGTDTGLEDSKTTISLEFVNTLDSEKAKSTKYADSGVEIILGNEDDAGYRFAAVKGQENNVYKLSSDIINAIYTLQPFDYILKIPVLIDINTVENIQISTEEQNYEMSVDTEKEVYQLGKRKVKKEVFTNLYQELASVMLDKEPGPEAKEGKEVLAVVYHRNREDAPDTQVIYYEYEGDDAYCLVEINGTQKFLVKKVDVETLVKQIEEEF